MTCGMCRKGIEDFPKVDHEINGSSGTYMGGIVERQLYMCPGCGEYWLDTRIIASWTGQELSSGVEPVGYNLKKIRQQNE